MSGKILQIYTDGSCSSQDKCGGWSFVVSTPNSLTYSFGGALNTTVNQMELLAGVMAMQSLQKHLVCTCNSCGEVVLPSHSCPICCSENLGHSRFAGLKPVAVYSDSKYLVNGISEHVYDWRINKFKKRDGETVKNSFLWSVLFKLQLIHNADFKWVKGHAGVEHNELADYLAGVGRHSAKQFKAKRGKNKNPANDLIFDMQDTENLTHEAHGVKLTDFIISGSFRIQKTVSTSNFV